MRVHRIARKLRIRMSLLTRRISYTKDLGGPHSPECGQRHGVRDRVGDQAIDVVPSRANIGPCKR